MTLGWKASAVVGCVLLLAWGWLVMVQHLAAGWPHALYAVGAMLVIRGIALRDAPS